MQSSRLAEMHQSLLQNWCVSASRDDCISEGAPESASLLDINTVNRIIDARGNACVKFKVRGARDLDSAIVDSSHPVLRFDRKESR